MNSLRIRKKGNDTCEDNEEHFDGFTSPSTLSRLKSERCDCVSKSSS